MNAEMASPGSARSAGADWKGCWALLWRSVVFLPYMLLVGVTVLVSYLACLLLPVAVVAWAIGYQWAYAAVTAAAWLILLWLMRRCRLSRLLERPPSLL